MSILYFDAYSGTSGDMILAALFDLGVDRKTWSEALSGLAVEGYKIRFNRIKRHGISAQKVDVTVTDAQPSRHLTDIKKIIAESCLPAPVKRNARDVFTTLARAEANVHGTSVNKVHFHEVGAVDAIVDIVGTCLAIHLLGVTAVYCSPIGVGRGTSRCAHGPMPLPPPATIEILTGFPIHFHEVDVELATPTGSALLKSLAVPQTPPSDVTIKAIGNGAGSRNVAEIPNILRAMLLDRLDEGEMDSAVLLETNIDDMNPELYPHVIERLLRAGAMDAYLTPILMKKGRPGVVLSVLCSPGIRNKAVDIIYHETTTLGIRISSVERLKLSRKAIVVETEFGSVDGKEANWRGQIRRTPEFEACRKLAVEKGMSLQEIYHAFNVAAERLTLKK